MKRTKEPFDLYCHNSRLGTVAFILKKIFNCRVYFIIDNDEAKLSYQQAKLSRSLIEKLFRYYDVLSIKVSEFFVGAISEHLYFISQNDANNSALTKKRSYDIIPVCVEELIDKSNIPKQSICLFTASFSFSPNVAALNRLLFLAGKFPEIEFIIAGRELSKYDSLNHFKNVQFINSPSDNEMKALFRKCNGYVTPVEEGSGMKTKIAEALSAGLYVYSSYHSAIGYEKVMKDGCIFIYDNCGNDFKQWLEELKDYNPQTSINSFKNNYTFERAGEIISLVLKGSNYKSSAK